MRLALYLRCLEECEGEGQETISSAEIERLTGIAAGQVRKDLSYFGEFGKPGLGYEVLSLRERIAAIMNLDRHQPVVILGAGNLGMALIGYLGFQRSGFPIVGLFDNDPAKIGRRISGQEIEAVEHLADRCKAGGVTIGIIATPAGAAQEAADRMVAAGITAILNFAPARVTVREGIRIRTVDLTKELQILSYYLLRLPKAGPERADKPAAEARAK